MTTYENYGAASTALGKEEEMQEVMNNGTPQAAAIVVLGALAFLIAARYFMGVPIVEVLSK
ncbi:hypothetical protein [Streptomyces sp. NPDC051677]|uniref:hypothetical protein n=1 Tax=Streptomyces sp. NPDC051677 TaxID=3365669 RepID=UPI0037D40818